MNKTFCASDIDECMESNGTLCHDLALCVNTEGNYTCECLDGYLGDGVYSCYGMWDEVTCIATHFTLS